jgi:hypothetical protein
LSKAIFIANKKANEAIVFSPPESYSSESKTKRLFGGVAEKIVPASKGNYGFSKNSSAEPTIF